MYGETQDCLPPDFPYMGLSPHVRGNQLRKVETMVLVGSIPACTGKPAVPPTCGAAARVYPRMYGETRPAPRRLRRFAGLSPHVRGNLRYGEIGPDRPGSIPACTGKPGWRRRYRSGFRVYPRMYGETSDTQDAPAIMEGLSPHVRGNHRGAQPARAKEGSIPACTGKPDWNWHICPHLGVYPRMYGETRRRPAHRAQVHGLSPHVRGNHDQALAYQRPLRSIPACTGKPPEP